MAKHMLLTAFAFTVFCAPVLCSEIPGEVSDQLVLQVKLQGNFKDGSRKLTLLGEDRIAKISGIVPPVVRYHNYPFFPVGVQKQENIMRVKCTSHENCTVEKEHLEGLNLHYQGIIQYFPYVYFKDEDGNFEPNGAEFYSFQHNIDGGHSLELALQFDSDLEPDETLEVYLNDIIATPRYLLEDQEELVRFDIIREEDGKIIYGDDAFGVAFAKIKELKEVVEDKQAELAEKAKELLSLQSSLRRYRIIGIGISGGLFTMIMLYIFRDILRDKFYATA